MPLASSLSAAQKRAEVVEMERRQQERRASVMQGRRRRLSLPTTIQSSTVATKSKVDRRRSIRRENSSNSLASANAAASKENADNNTNINHKRTSSNIHCYYSPPETRSAKKKKLELNPAFFDTIKPSSLLSFPPPNQAANEQREIKRLEQAERERYVPTRVVVVVCVCRQGRTGSQRVLYCTLIQMTTDPFTSFLRSLDNREQRIEQARRNGQLVILSPSNRALYLPINAPTLANNSKDGDHDGMDKSVPTSKSLSSSKENEDGIMRDKHEELLQKMSKDMLIMAKNQAEANDKRRLSEVDLLQKVQELITAESQAVIQSAREQTNETLRADLNGLRDKLATEQQQHSVETTRMAMELQQFQQKVEHAQELQLSLQGQIVLLQEEKKELLLSIVSLQSSLDSAKSQLQLDRTTLTELQKQNVSGQKEFSDQLAQYQVTNTELSVQMSELVNSKEKLEQSIVAYQQAITRLEREVIPFLEASLESERDKVARSESDLESHVASLEESQTMIQDLQQQVEQLQRQNEEDRVRFQSLSENSQVEFQTLTATSNEQEQQILALTQALEKLLSELEMTCQIRDNLQAAHNTLLIEQKQLNDALEESMVQVDQTVTENKELEKKLAMALKLLEAAKATVESDEFTKSAVIEKLNDQLKEERKHREEIETYRQQTELQMHEKEKQVTVLEKTLKLTLEERDMARNNMLGFNEREEDLYLKLRESDRIRREMHSRIMQLMGNIRVFVRVRPAMPNEQSIDSPGSGDALNVGVSHKNTNAATSSTTPFSFPGVYDGRRPADGKNQRHVTSSGDDLTKNVIEVMEPYKDRGGLQDRRKKWRFGFDSVFSPAHGQDDVWEATQPMIQCAVDGFNVTIFAYGQTGSGVSMHGGLLRLVIPQFSCSHIFLFPSKRKLTQCWEQMDTTA